MSLTFPLLVAAGITLSPCEVAGARQPAVCGAYSVWEDRAVRAGRQVPIHITILRATRPGSLPDPLVFLQGGPGDAPSFNAAFYDRVFAGVRESHDLVLIDPRGTGKSASLTCPELAEPDSEGVLVEHWLNPEGVRKCRSRLEQSADLRQYTTANVADDLDDVLGALGYERVNLYGTSYGTRLAQVLMRRHPDRVRTVALKGVVSPREAVPTSHALAAEQGWKDLVARCGREPDCVAAYPHLDQDLRTLAAELGARPLRLSIPAAKPGPVKIVLTRGLFGEAFRNVLYTPQAAAGAPKLLQAMRSGDPSAIADLVLATRTLTAGSRLAAGFFLSVTCTEDAPYLDLEAGLRSASTFAGDYRLREQTSACAQWPRGSVPASHRQLLQSDIPTLLLSGELDPVTPVSGALEVAATLPRGRSVILRNNGHPIGNAEACIGRMIGALIVSGRAADIDASCAARIPPVPFLVPLPVAR